MEYCKNGWIQIFCHILNDWMMRTENASGVKCENLNVFSIQASVLYIQSKVQTHFHFLEMFPFGWHFYDLDLYYFNRLWKGCGKSAFHNWVATLDISL